jgi:50S ribosomal subunit-associated GTPase HflX
MEEQLTMRTREIDRLKVIHDIFENRITWKQAAEQVCVTERQIGRICARVRIEGNKGMIHGLGGKPSNHQLQEGVLDRALSRQGDKFA